MGRPVARAMASLVGTEAVDGDQLEVAEPAWPTPDPWKREFRPRSRFWRRSRRTTIRPLLAPTSTRSWLPCMPSWASAPLETAPGRHMTSLPTTRWLTDRGDRIAAGVVVGFTGWTMGGATATLISPDHRIAVIEHHAQLLRAIGPADGPLVCQARVTHDVDEFHVTAAEVTDTNGHVVATAGFTSIATPINAGALHRRSGCWPPSCSVTSWALPNKRRSWATRLGDTDSPPITPWSAVSSTPSADSEIKTMGDGFLALFDVPARAVQCAKAISRRTARRRDGGDDRPSYRRVRSVSGRRQRGRRPCRGTH